MTDFIRRPSGLLVPPEPRTHRAPTCDLLGIGALLMGASPVPATWRFRMWGGGGAGGAGAFLDVALEFLPGVALRVKAAHSSATNRSNSSESFGGGGGAPGGDLSCLSLPNPGTVQANYYAIAAGGGANGAAGEGGGAGGCDLLGGGSIGQDGGSNGANGTGPGRGAKQGYYAGGDYPGAAGDSGQAGSALYGGNGGTGGGAGWFGGGSSGSGSSGYWGGSGGGCSIFRGFPGALSSQLLDTASANRGTPGKASDPDRGNAGSPDQSGRVIVMRNGVVLHNLVGGQTLDLITW